MYAEAETVRIIACSDFQHLNGNADGKMLVQGILGKISEAGMNHAEGFLYCGDYDYEYEYTETAAGVAALKEVVGNSMSDTAHMVFVQGNHDQVPAGTVGMSSSGDCDPANGQYGVFVINEDDYMWANTDESTVKQTAKNLITYLNKKTVRKI